VIDAANDQCSSSGSGYQCLLRKPWRQDALQSEAAPGGSTALSFDVARRL